MATLADIVRSESLLFAFGALVGWLRSRRRFTEPQRILIYKPDHMGDFLMATPGLQAIRRRFPDAEIKLVAGEWSKDVLKGNRSFDEVIYYNSPRFCRPPYQPDSFREFKRRLGSWKPDLVIGLRDDWRTLIASLWEPAFRVVRGSVQFRKWRQMKFGGSQAWHELDLIWETLLPIGITPAQVERLEYVVLPEERNEAEELIRSEAIDLPFTVLHPGSANAMREWDLERYVKVARFVASEYGMRIVIIGAPHEAKQGSALAELLSDLRPIDLSGRLNLRRTAALLERADLYIGSDGGMMHVATALDVPTVGLFGPGHYYVFHPVGRHVRAISHWFPCAPCLQVKCVRPHDTCMQAISSEEVITAVTDLLKEDADKEARSQSEAKRS